MLTPPWLGTVSQVSTSRIYQQALRRRNASCLLHELFFGKIGSGNTRLPPDYMDVN